MISAREEKAACILVGEKAILSDLAKEYAKKYGISIARDEGETGGKGSRV